MSTTKCIECGNEFEYKTNKPPRCHICKEKRRKEYLKNYKKTNKYQQCQHKHNIKKRKYENMFCPCKKCGKLIKYKTALKKYCESCFKEKQKEWGIKSRENYKRNETSEQIKKKLEYQKQYRSENKERIKEWRKTKHGKEIIKKSFEKFKKTSKYKDKIRRRRLKRKGDLYKVTHSFTQEEWNIKLIESNGICPMCKKNISVEKLTLDHIFPISKAEKGRVYTIEDVQPLCIRCNTKKNDKVITK